MLVLREGDKRYPEVQEQFCQITLKFKLAQATTFLRV